MNNLPSSSITTRRESFEHGLVVRVDEQESGRPILALHAGGGLPTVAGLAKALSYFNITIYSWHHHNFCCRHCITNGSSFHFASYSPDLRHKSLELSGRRSQIC